MNKEKLRSRIMGLSHGLMIVLMAALLLGALGFVNAGAQADAVRYVNTMAARVEDGPEETVELPHSFKPLTGRTKVTLTAWIQPDSDDVVYIKSVYSPAKIYLDGKLCFEFGKEENYPGFMLDPATEHHMIETHGEGKPMELTMEFYSPNTRNVMTIHPPIVGNSKEVTLERCHRLGIPLILAISQMIYGISLMLISAILMLVDRKGQVFLWLGLMALLSGMWVFGENNFSGFVFKNATALYLMAFIGFYTFIIPLLHFTRTTVVFEHPLPVWSMELFAVVTAGIALALQLMGLVSFSTSMYFFHLSLPLMLILLTAVVAVEAIRYHNHNAGRLLMPVGFLALAAIMELLNYQISLTYVFSSLFQVGIIFFLLVMGVTAGLAVKESVSIKNQERELHFQQGLMDIQMKEQASRSRMLREREQMLSHQRHDLRHHLNAIQELAGDNQELLDYLRRLNDQIPRASQVFCENRPVNAILSHYAALCREKGINLDLKVAVPADNPNVDDNKLCVIFGNLLENAVEACERMTEGERFITLHSRVQHGLLIITMENSFNGQVRREGQRFYSSKRPAYGIGLASIRSVALEGQGEAQFEGEGKLFRSSVYLRVE